MPPRTAWLAAPLLLIACAPPLPSVAPIAPVAPPPAISPAAPLKPAEAPMTRESALDRLFSAPAAAEAWFAPSFLAAVPVAKIDAILGQIRAVSGTFESVHADGSHFVATFEKGAWEGSAQLDDQGRFTGLVVRPAAAKGATVEEAMAAFRALPGKVSVLVVSDDVERGAVEPGLPLAVGSTFKLAILAALRADVDRKKRSWRDVVELVEGQRSLPSGILQAWPDRAPVTLYTLAGLMISISDNTATDAVLRLVGRGAVEALAPRNKPFLMTREMFQLKGAGGGEALSAYQKGNEAERRRVLEGLAKKPLPPAESYPTEPTALDVEWLFDARELCALMKKVHDLPLMGINPGVAKKADWDAVAYKGGSEPGVLSMTTWLQKGSHQHCVSATWNAPHKLEELGFVSAYGKAIGALEK